jgi:hypothetical protein
MEESGSFKMLVSHCNTTWRHNPKAFDLTLSWTLRRDRNFCHHIQSGSEVHPAFYPLHTEGSSLPGTNEGLHTPFSGCELYAFMLWCLKDYVFSIT